MSAANFKHTAACEKYVRDAAIKVSGIAHAQRAISRIEN
jgi:hypothetical protein